MKMYIDFFLARIMVKEANFHCMHGNNEVIDFEVVKPLDYFIGFATGMLNIVNPLIMFISIDVK